MRREGRLVTRRCGNLESQRWAERLHHWPRCWVFHYWICPCFLSFFVVQISLETNQILWTRSRKFLFLLFSKCFFIFPWICFFQLQDSRTRPSVRKSRTQFLIMNILRVQLVTGILGHILRRNLFWQPSNVYTFALSHNSRPLPLGLTMATICDQLSPPSAWASSRHFLTLVPHRVGDNPFYTQLLPWKQHPLMLLVLPRPCVLMFPPQENLCFPPPQMEPRVSYILLSSQRSFMILHNSGLCCRRHRNSWGSLMLPGIPFLPAPRF